MSLPLRIQLVNPSSLTTSYVERGFWSLSHNSNVPMRGLSHVYTPKKPFDESGYDLAKSGTHSGHANFYFRHNIWFASCYLIRADFTVAGVRRDPSLYAVVLYSMACVLGRYARINTERPCVFTSLWLSPQPKSLLLGCLLIRNSHPSRRTFK